jgi:hypothetical protein
MRSGGHRSNEANSYLSSRENRGANAASATGNIAAIGALERRVPHDQRHPHGPSHPGAFRHGDFPAGDTPMIAEPTFEVHAYPTGEVLHMMFRRRKMATVTDIETARRAASANGAYDPSWESGPDAALSARRRSLESLSVPVNFPPDACPCGGHIGWIQHEDRFVGNCYGRCRKRHVELGRETDDTLRRRAREDVWERRFREACM